MKSFQVGDKVRIKVKNDYIYWSHCNKVPLSAAVNREVCDITSIEIEVGEPVILIPYVGFMHPDDIELVDEPDKQFTLKEYMGCLDKDHPARKEYEELMECKFRLEGLEK